MPLLKRYCLATDLKNDPQMIAEYEEYHRAVWPAVLDSLREAGIEQMEIYRVENRLILVMEVNETFSFERKAAMDTANATVVEWETLMWKYQQALPTAKPGQKWLLMEKVFQL